MGIGCVIAHVYVFAHVYCSDACSARRSEKGWQGLQRPQGWPRELQTVSPSPIRGSRRSRPKGPHPVRLEARRKPSRRCAWCVVVKREKRKLSTGGHCLTNDRTDHTGNNRRRESQRQPRLTHSPVSRHSPRSPEPLTGQRTKELEWTPTATPGFARGGRNIHARQRRAFIHRWRLGGRRGMLTTCDAMLTT